MLDDVSDAPAVSNGLRAKYRLRQVRRQGLAERPHALAAERGAAGA